MNLIKKFFSLIIILGFFPAVFSTAKMVNPQPAYAAVNDCVVTITSGAPSIGQPVTTKMTNVAGFYKYKIDLVWTDLFGISTDTKTKWFDQLGATEFVFTWDSSYFQREGFYYFYGWQTSDNQMCKENPPQFMLTGVAKPAVSDG